MRLLTSGDERLLEVAADGLTTEKAEVAAARGERKDFVRPWRAKPLELDRQRRRIEVIARGRSRKGMGRQRRRGDVERGKTCAIIRAEPAIRPPLHFLNGSFATERAAPAVAQRTAAEEDHIGVPGLCLDDVGVPGALELDVG